MTNEVKTETITYTKSLNCFVKYANRLTVAKNRSGAENKPPFLEARLK